MLLQFLIHSSIHPFSSTYPGPGSGGSRVSRVPQTSFSPATLLLGDAEAFPGQMRYIIPPAVSGSAPGFPPSRMCLENLEGEAPGRHPNQMLKPPQLTPFDAEEQWLTLSSLRMSELVTLSQCYLSHNVLTACY